MEIIFITIPITLLFIATAAIIFFWASKGGQFDDLDSPAHRILFDDDIQPDDTKPTDQKIDKNPK
ncbi:MAG: cbb3-type cytochrome oxidase assembly protein CcoS [Bermanella sp.]